MLAPLDSPIVCPITVGRAPHLDAIDRLLERLLAGAGQTLECLGAKRASVSLAPDPVFLRASGGLLYVYSRLEGIVQEIDPTGQPSYRCNVRTGDCALLDRNGDMALGNSARPGG